MRESNSEHQELVEDLQLQVRACGTCRLSCSNFIDQVTELIAERQELQQRLEETETELADAVASNAK